MKLKSFIMAMVLIIPGVIFTGCGDDIEYGSIEGKATGTIDFSEEVPMVEIENVVSEVGEEIDYIGEIELVGSEDLSNYQISVNTTDVKTDEPGTYTATYTITYDDETYTKQVTVTVKGESTTGQTTARQTTTVQATTVQAATQPATTQQITTSQTATTTQSQGIPVAKIELLSGEVVSITCTNAKYIVSTRTDVSEVTRDGVKYSVEKLIITYNTGIEQVLETIESKIS